MGTNDNVSITVEAIIDAPVEQVWQYWTEPEHVKGWTFANEDWHAPHAENDLRVGGSFVTRMEAKDGSFGFDFGGVYDEVRTYSYIAYSMSDGRKVEISFTAQGGGTKVVETFDAEASNSVDMQRAGWQAILDNFKKYCERSK